MSFFFICYLKAQIQNISSLDLLFKDRTIEVVENDLRNYHFDLDTAQKIKTNDGRILRVYTYRQNNSSNLIRETIIIFKEENDLKPWIEEVAFMTSDSNKYYKFKDVLKGMSGAKIKGDDIQDECSVTRYWYNATNYDFKICKDKKLEINSYNIILSHNYPPGIK